MNKLEQLSQMTVIVADTGNLNEIQQYRPQDATTNPSLLLSSVDTTKGKAVLQQAIELCDGSVGHCADMYAVLMGREILSLVPGRVSTEIDARLSFDTNAMVQKAREIIELYERQRVSKERILIKVASTWEGIKAAEVLEKEGIRCNLTLLFSLCQAIACAQAGVFLISPFVGRILDWHKQQGAHDFTPENDPGVRSVKAIYEYFKTYDYPTIVMGASFRNVDQVLALAGCDYLTISPSLLGELEEQSSPVKQALDASKESNLAKRAPMSEPVFRWELNQDAMATEKLSEGIRKFALDQAKLESIIQSKLHTA